MESYSAIQSDSDVRIRAHKICCDHLGGAWAKISPDELSLTPVSGGMSNLLFCCSLPDNAPVMDGKPKRVLLRFYGDQSRNCDMSVQLTVFKLLSKQDLGPKLYGDFEGGRIEEFLPANSLTCDELINKEISCIIARKLAAVHCLEVPMKRESTWILDRFNEWLEYIDKQPRSPTFGALTRQSTINVAHELLSIDFGVEVNFLREIFETIDSPIVFSHNDLHQGNILLARECDRRPLLEQRLILIDFEYCSYNYRAYDIANHFCEWCFEYDTRDWPHFDLFEDRLPSKEMQEEFVRNYLKQQKLILRGNKPAKRTGSGEDNFDKRRINGKAIHRQEHNSNGHPNNNLHSTNGTADDIKEDLDKVMDELKPFFMVSNLLWTLWCIRSAFCSDLKFGYWEHSMARWRLYSRFKQEYIKEKKSTANGLKNAHCT